MGSAGSLFAGVIAGAFGMAYFVYGRKQGRVIPMVAGVALCVYPYFFDSVIALCVIGVLLLALPFVFRD